MKLYLAGPMRGIKDFNFPLFHHVASELRKWTDPHLVVSPAEADEAEGFDPTSNDGAIADYTRREMLGRDMKLLAGCEGIVMLPGWSKSGGAKLELHFAQETGLYVYYWNCGTLDSRPLMEDIPPVPSTASTGEVRITDPTTGGQKGSKAQRLDLIPPEALAKISEVYDYGARKYAPQNWRKGYAWSLSYGALLRHLNSFWSGEDNDPESGLPHLSHAGFHVLALLEYSTNPVHAGRDDRYKGTA